MISTDRRQAISKKIHRAGKPITINTEVKPEVISKFKIIKLNAQT